MLATLAFVVAQAPIPGWTMYVSTQDHFTVELPAKPTISTIPLSAQGVTGKARNYTVKTPLVNASISAITISDKSRTGTLDVAKGIVMGLMNRIGGKPGESVTMVYSGRKGQETRFQDGTGHFGSIWITGESGRLYALTILGVKAPPVAEAKRFFASFHTW